jgi:hypothetical protein
MDNQPQFDPNQPQPQGEAGPQPAFQPRSAPVQPQSSPLPIPPRPTFSPPPGYQQAPFPAAPQPQILPQPVTPGQPPYSPPTSQLQMPPPTAYQPPPATPAKKHKFLWWLSGLIVVVLLVGAVLLVVRTLQTQSTKAPQKVSDQFISDLQKDDPLDAYSLTSTSYQKAYSDVNFKKIVNQASSGLQGPVSITARQLTKTSPPQAVLIYQIPTQYTTQYIKVSLENTDTWRVTSFAASTLKPAVTAAK